MLKILGYNVHKVLGYSFKIITGYCYIDVIKFIMPLTEIEILDISTVGSLIVVSITGLYWLTRLVLMIVEMPHKKEERKILKRTAEIQRQIDLYKLEIEKTKLTQQKLKNEKESRDIQAI